jgi:5-methylcytosine-specific restriction endonuclease McrA
VTPLLPHPDHYLQNLIAMTSQEARRMRKNAIKEHWQFCCAYCGERKQPEALTIDHVRPRTLGGSDFTHNLVPSCAKCNRAKGSNNWLNWMRETFGHHPDREQLILSHINT